MITRSTDDREVVAQIHLFGRLVAKLQKVTKQLVVGLDDTTQENKKAANDTILHGAEMAVKAIIKKHRNVPAHIHWRNHDVNSPYIEALSGPLIHTDDDLLVQIRAG